MIRKFKEFIPSLGNQVFVDEQATVIGDVSLEMDLICTRTFVPASPLSFDAVFARPNSEQDIPSTLSI